MAENATDGRVHVEERRGWGVLTLDRQKTLNALSNGMVRTISAALARWRDDPSIRAVLIKAVPGKAFCAGGDIRVVAEATRAGGIATALAFLRRRVPDELAHRHARQALRGLDGWHHHGRRARRLGARHPSHRHRAHGRRDARDGDRLLSRHRRQPLPAAAAIADRPLSGAHRRQDRRCHGDPARHRHALRAQHRAGGAGDEPHRRRAAGRCPGAVQRGAAAGRARYPGDRTPSSPATT